MGSDFTFKANGGVLNEYVVLNDSDYYTPEVDGQLISE